jgi:predicted enzyme related to lactoylglutathione lyase
MLQLLGFVIDCPDPMQLAAFYSQVTGRAIREGSSDNFAGITFGEIDLAFQRVADYRPPRWPDGEHPKQFHLDFEVAEIEPEQRRVVKLGATLQKDFIGLDGYGWQVYTDPVGHPFCLCRHQGVTWTDNGLEWLDDELDESASEEESALENEETELAGDPADDASSVEE